MQERTSQSLGDFSSRLQISPSLARLGSPDCKITAFPALLLAAVSYNSRLVSSYHGHGPPGSLVPHHRRQLPLGWSHIVINQAYVQYIPPIGPGSTQDSTTPSSVPILFVHGGALTGTMWESTPDRRPGWVVRHRVDLRIVSMSWTVDEVNGVLIRFGQLESSIAQRKICGLAVALGPLMILNANQNLSRTCNFP